jgi:hypothetical protein
MPNHDPSRQGLRQVVVRVRRTKDEAEAADREWWAALTPEQRLELTWQLSEQLYRLRGEFNDEPGICRSVARLGKTGTAYDQGVRREG